MHLLHIISTLDRAAGGPAEGVRLLLSQSRHGCTGEVVTLDAPDAPCLRDLPFTATGLGPIHSVYGYHRRLYPWLREHRHRFDGFLVNGMWQYCGLAAMLAAGNAIPYMVYVHGMLDPYFRRRFPLKHVKKLPYWYLVELWVLHRASRVLFTTETERRLACESFAFSSWKPAVIPYGVQVPDTPAEEKLAAFHAAVPNLMGQRFLLFLGRIHPKKGCDLLIEAFCKEAVGAPDLHLVMAGPDSGNWLPALQKMASRTECSDRIHWPGMLVGPAKWGALAAAEAFVLPSHQENFGIAVAEALACGVPVLLSDKVNLADTIVNDGCALIEADTLEGTRLLLRRWLSLNTEQRGKMGSMALAAFRQHFDLRRSMDAICGLFARAANHHAVPSEKRS